MMDHWWTDGSLVMMDHWWTDGPDGFGNHAWCWHTMVRGTGRWLFVTRAFQHPRLLIKWWCPSTKRFTNHCFNNYWYWPTSIHRYTQWDATYQGTPLPSIIPWWCQEWWCYTSANHPASPWNTLNAYNCLSQVIFLRLISFGFFNIEQYKPQ